MTKQLILIPVITVTIIIGCTGSKPLDKQELASSTSIAFGETRSTQLYGLSVEFKKMETDSFAIFFLISNDSSQTDSLPININEVILRNSLQSRGVGSEFRLIFTKKQTQLSIRSRKQQFESIFNRSLEIVYNQSFDSSLIVNNGIGTEDLQRYHSDKFVTSRMACAIVGDFELSYIESLIERNFSNRTIGAEYKQEFNFSLDTVYFMDTAVDSTPIDSLK